MRNSNVLCFVRKTCGKRFRGVCDYCTKNINHKQVEDHYEERSLACGCCGNENVVEGHTCNNCGEIV